MKRGIIKSIGWLVLFLVVLPLNFIAQKKEGWKWQYLTRSDEEVVNFQQFKDGIVYLEEMTVGKKQFLIAFDVKRGTVKWKTPLQESVTNLFTSSIKQIEFGVKNLSILTKNSKLFVINQTNGKLQWQSQNQEEINTHFLQIKNEGNSIFTVGEEIGLRKTDAQNGSEDWSFKRCFNFSSESYNTLIVKGETAIFPCGSGKLYAVDTNTGQEKWRVNYGRGDVNHLYESGGIVFAIVGNFNNDGGVLQALNFDDGKKIWEDKLPGKGTKYVRSFSITDSYCLLANEDFLIKYDLKTGKRLWTNMSQTVGSSISQTAQTKTELIEVNWKGWISATSLETGKVLWKTQIAADGERNFYPKHLEIIGEVGYANTRDELAAVNLQTGKLLWKVKMPVNLKGSDKLGNLYFEAAGIMIGAINIVDLNKKAQLNKEISVPARVAKRTADRVFTVGSGRGSGSGSGSGTSGTSLERFVSELEVVEGKAYYIESFTRQRKSNLYEVNLENGQKRAIIRGIEGISFTNLEVVGNIAYLSGVFARSNEKTFAKVRLSQRQTQSSSDQLWAIDIEKEEVLWQLDVSLGRNSNILNVDDKIVFAATNGTVYAVDQKGSLLWKQSMRARSSARESRVFFGEGRLYFSALEDFTKSKIFALDPQKGEILWLLEKDFPLINLVIKEDMLYFGDRQSVLYAIDGKTGKESWKEQLHQTVSNIQFKEDNLLVTGGFDGWLTSLNRKTGELFWERKFRGDKTDLVDQHELLGFKDGWTLDIKTGERKGKLSGTYSNSKNIVQGSRDFIIYLEQDEINRGKDDHPSARHQDLTKVDVKNNRVLWSLAL